MTEFTVTVEMKDKRLSTFFKHKIFTIPAECRKGWKYAKISAEGLWVEFKLGVDPAVLARYAQNQEMLKLLQGLDTLGATLVIQNSNGLRYNETNQYIKCVMPEIMLGYLKKIFVSTIVYQAQKCPIPQVESISFTFRNDGAVLISDLQTFVPQGNPFYEYAKNAVATLSVEAIGLQQYSIENDNEVKDFYNRSQMSEWKEAATLQKETGLDDKAGVYMLYDENANTFYVGKAIKLKNRIQQHRDNVNGNDPIPNFTHYRYSVISGEYREFLYLIENASIHDCAWLLDMPTAKKFKPSLAVAMKKAGKNTLGDCKMVNTVEHQTRKQ